jgi:hypothetical protein
MDSFRRRIRNVRLGLKTFLVTAKKKFEGWANAKERADALREREWRVDIERVDE